MVIASLDGAAHTAAVPLPSLAAVIPTYNRCPYGVPEFHRNPLTWCLYSLLQQRGSGLRRVVVVDDASTDYTKAVLRHITELAARKSEVEIVCSANARRSNPCRSRNIGLAAAGTEQVFFMDDDCVLGPDTLALAQCFRRELARSPGVRLGAVHLPVFLRTDDYEATVTERRIGRIYPRTGEIYANFRCFPDEYAHVRGDTRVGVALPVDFVQEVFLIETAELKAVGGFVDAGFTSIHHEGLFLSLALRSRGLAQYHLLHPRAYTIHLRYGSGHTATGAATVHPGLEVEDRNVPLDAMLREAAMPRTDTGGRSAPQEIVFDVIAGKYSLLLHLDACGADAWAAIAREALVHGADPAGLCRFPPLPMAERHRVKLWQEAVRAGREAYEWQVAAGFSAGARVS